MGRLGEGCKKPYNQQVGCIIKLALKGLAVTALGPTKDMSSYNENKW